MSQSKSSRRGTGVMLLMAAGAAFLMMLVYLATMLFGTPNTGTTLAFWASAGLTTTLSLAGGRLLR
jgi:hypothetical protein